MATLELFGLAASAAVLALAAALLWLARAQRRHRRHLDARIDELARIDHRQALAADRRADALARHLGRLEGAQRASHLLDLVGAAERAGRIAPDAARRLESAALALRAELVDPAIEASGDTSPGTESDPRDEPS